MIQVTASAEELKKLFNDVEEVYFSEDTISKTDLVSGQIDVIELPVTDEGVNFDPGSAEKQEHRLTTGKIWTTKVTKGDSDISFQIPAIPGTINSLFLEEGSKISGNVTFGGDKAPASLSGKNYTAAGFTFTPKKVVGALVFPSADRQTVIILPAVEMYGSPKTDGSNPMYFDVSVTPVANEDGDEIYILTEKTTNTNVTSA